MIERFITGYAVKIIIGLIISLFLFTGGTYGVMKYKLNNSISDYNKLEREYKNEKLERLTKEAELKNLAEVNNRLSIKLNEKITQLSDIAEKEITDTLDKDDEENIEPSKTEIRYIDVPTDCSYVKDRMERAYIRSGKKFDKYVDKKSRMNIDSLWKMYNKRRGR